MVIFSNIIYIIGNLFLNILEAVLFKKCVDPKNVLIIRNGYLGDTFCSIPSINAVKKKFPEAKFILMTAKSTDTNPILIDILNKLVGFNEVFAYELFSIKKFKNLISIIKQLRNKKIDLLVYLGQSDDYLLRLLRDMLFFKLAGSKSVVGFKWNKHRFFRIAQRNYRVFDNEVNRLIKSVVRLRIKNEVVWDIKKEKHDFGLSTPIIVIHPFTKFPVNRWPVDRFISLCGILQKKYNASIVLIGDSSCKKEAELFMEKLNSNAVNLVGMTDFLQLINVLQNCDMLVSNDSGPVHVASAVDIPVVGIYTARDYPNCWYPWGIKHIILRKDVSCQICLKTECNTMECIKNISVDEVVDTCDKILK